MYIVLYIRCAKPFCLEYNDGVGGQGFVAIEGANPQKKKWMFYDDFVYTEGTEEKQYEGPVKSTYEGLNRGEGPGYILKVVR